ncbi:MAG: tyrosine recombinase XerC [Clostridia bacterium]|nr:tyrosine recombinase XerC [Clostridia bacterium]
MDYLKESPAVIRDYLVYLETIMGRSPRTVNEYYLDLRTFFRYILQKRGLASPAAEFSAISLEKVDLELVRSVTRSEVLDFLVFTARERPKHHKSSETAYGNEVRTRARKVSSLRGFYKYYCDKLQLVEENPTKSLDMPKAQKALPKHLTLRESLQLLESVDGKYRERDYCILTLFLNCGMRVSELVGINLQDISDDRLRLLGKGNKERMIYLNQACLNAIEAYLPHRITPKAGHKNALFISQFGQRINVQTVKALVKKYLGAAGLSQKHCSVHKLRHTAATLMYQNGVDVRTLKEVLGHENLDTTMIYTHVVDQNMKDASNANPLSQISPPGRKKRPQEDEE